MKEFSVPANTKLDGKLFQLFRTLLVKNENKQPHNHNSHVQFKKIQS